MPTTIDSAGITFNDATSLTSANIGTAQLVNGSVTASKLGTTEQKQLCKAWVNFDGTNAFSPNPSTTAIRSSYNVSSVTRLAAGDYEINLQNPLSDILYSCLATDNSRGLTSTAPLTISKFSVASYNTTFIPANENIICAVAFGN
jgi:hypothetical protein